MGRKQEIGHQGDTTRENKFYTHINLLTCIMAHNKQGRHDDKHCLILQMNTLGTIGVKGLIKGYTPGKTTSSYWPPSFFILVSLSYNKSVCSQKPPIRHTLTFSVNGNIYLKKRVALILIHRSRGEWAGLWKIPLQRLKKTGKYLLTVWIPHLKHSCTRQRLKMKRCYLKPSENVAKLTQC